MKLFQELSERIRDFHLLKQGQNLFCGAIVLWRLIHIIEMNDSESVQKGYEVAHCETVAKLLSFPYHTFHVWVIRQLILILGFYN